MNFAIFRRRFAVAVAVTALVFPLVGQARARSNESNTPTDKQFLTTAAEINLGEIELGKLAEQKGNNAAVKDFGKRMITDHSLLEDQVKTVAKNEGVTLPTTAGPDVAALQKQLAKDSGAKFDQAYIQHMLAGHNRAITTFEYQIEHGQNGAIKSYAESALPVIQDHIRIAEDVAGKMGLSGKSGLDQPGKAISASAVPE